MNGFIQQILEATKEHIYKSKAVVLPIDEFHVHSFLLI